MQRSGRLSIASRRGVHRRVNPSMTSPCSPLPYAAGRRAPHRPSGSRSVRVIGRRRRGPAWPGAAASKSVSERCQKRFGAKSHAGAPPTAPAPPRPSSATVRATRLSCCCCGCPARAWNGPRDRGVGGRHHGQDAARLAGAPGAVQPDRPALRPRRPAGSRAAGGRARCPRQRDRRSRSEGRAAHCRPGTAAGPARPGPTGERTLSWCYSPTGCRRAWRGDPQLTSPNVSEREWACCAVANLVGEPEALQVRHAPGHRGDCPGPTAHSVRPPQCENPTAATPDARPTCPLAGPSGGRERHGPRGRGRRHSVRFRAARLVVAHRQCLTYPVPSPEHAPAQELGRRGWDRHVQPAHAAGRSGAARRAAHTGRSRRRTERLQGFTPFSCIQRVVH